MTFTISRQQLSTELTLLSAALEKKETLPILSYVRLEFQGTRLTLTATNLNVTLTSELGLLAGSNPESYCLLLRQLSQLIKLFDGDEVHLTTRANQRIEVKCGSGRHLLSSQLVAEFPDVDKAVEVGASLPAKTLKAMLDAVRYSMLPSDGVVKSADIPFTGAQFRSKDGKLEVQGSRKVTLALATCAFTGPEFCAVIPPQAVSALAAFDDSDVGIGVTDKHATFTCGPRQLTARLLIGQFPDWSNVLPKFKQSVSVESESLATATRRAMLTTNAENWEKFEPLRYTFSQDALTVESKGGDYGKSHEQVSATSTLNGANVLFGVNGNQILEFLRLTDKTVIELPEGNEPQLVRMRPGEVKDVDYSYVVCGVTLKSWSDG